MPHLGIECRFLLFQKGGCKGNRTKTTQLLSEPHLIAMDKKQLTFPVLKNNEILQFMADLEIPFTEQDILKPSSHRMLQVYEAFTEQLMGISREHYSQPSFACIELLEHPDIHQESLALIGFYRQLIKLFKGVGVDHFSVRDLLQPSTEVVQEIISALINFCRFREDRLQIFELCTQKSVNYFHPGQTSGRKDSIQKANIRICRKSQLYSFVSSRRTTRGRTTERNQC